MFEQHPRWRHCDHEVEDEVVQLERFAAPFGVDVARFAHGKRGGVCFEIERDHVAAIGSHRGRREDDRTDGALLGTLDHQTLMGGVAVGVPVVPPVGHLVVEADVAEGRQVPHVVIPVGFDVTTRQHRTHDGEVALVADDVLVGVSRTELLAARANALGNGVGQIVGIAREIGRPVPYAFDSGALQIEVSILFLGVGARVAARRVDVTLFDCHAGLEALSEVDGLQVAAVCLTPAFTGILDEIDEGLTKRYELHGLYLLSKL